MNPAEFPAPDPLTRAPDPHFPIAEPSFSFDLDEFGIDQREQFAVTEQAETDQTEVEEYTDEPKRGFFTRAAKLARAFKNDFSDASIAASCALIAATGTFAYEVGPGNETFVPIIGKHFIALGHTGIQSAVEVASSTGGFGVVQQVAAGSIIAAASSAFPRTVQAGNELAGDIHVKDRRKLRDLPFGRQVFYSFFLGAGFNVSREVFKVGVTDRLGKARVIARSAMLTGGTIATVATAADYSYDRWPGNPIPEKAVNWFIGNPYVLGSLSVAMLMYDGIAGKIQDRKLQKAQAAPSDAI